MYTSKVKPLYTFFLHSITIFQYKVGINFEKEILAVEKNNYLTKFGNSYIVYNLYTLTRTFTRVFKLKKCLFGQCSKTIDKEHWVYCGYGITLDGEGS